MIRQPLCSQKGPVKENNVFLTLAVFNDPQALVISLWTSGFNFTTVVVVYDSFQTLLKKAPAMAVG